ncbi:MAG: hypothetical protein D6703_07395 [Zetaproteobacteria bacterium]|nr:MAG: hypothetical protein D6703_07395 [Zetaproteobacteria bacterium]
MLIVAKDTPYRLWLPPVHQLRDADLASVHAQTAATKDSPDWTGRVQAGTLKAMNPVDEWRAWQTPFHV